MTVTKLACLAAVLGGIALGCASVVSFGSSEHTDASAVAALTTIGWVMGALALAAMGYTLVATAPVWLRLIVVIAVPLVGAALRETIAEASAAQADGWKGDAMGYAIVAAILLVGAAVAAANLGRAPTGERAKRPVAANGGHRKH